ncbi:MAG: hypothetical protein IPL32_01785 [Chloracidobacterium sp.]|nr:hypothetical protein [Chloracidobacterium sp.]
MSVPTHHYSCSTVKFYELTCRDCGDQVFFFQCTCGSKVLLDNDNRGHQCVNNVKQKSGNDLDRRHIEISKSEMTALKNRSKGSLDWAKANGVLARRVILAHNHPDSRKSTKISVGKAWDEYFHSLIDCNLCPFCFNPIKLISKERVPKSNSCAAVVPEHFLVVTEDDKPICNKNYSKKVKFVFVPRKTVFDQKCRCG